MFKRLMKKPEPHAEVTHASVAVMGPGSFGTWEITRFLQSVARNH